jgi:D-serine deaminase-like pyridoxal phosphate-dependent protein
MATIHDLPTPALLLDIDVLEQNLRRMSARCKELGVALRPHVKTHKCLEIAAAQRALGARGITVSTLAEARTFVDGGFDDITWAFPIIPGRAAEAAELASRVRLGVVIDSEPALRDILAAGAPFRVWLKIDCGNGRAGLSPGSEAIPELARQVIDGGLELAGLLSHSGDAYGAGSRHEMSRIADQEREAMTRLADRLGRDGIRGTELSVGSTPSMWAYRTLEGVSEARPGNYALYDYTQVLLGSCEVRQCAATVLTTVVSSRSDLGTSVVDAGALALSLDPGPALSGRRSYGEILDAEFPNRVRRNARLTALSQEHGIVSRPFPVGTRLRVVPNHSCLTVACFDAFSVVRGDEVLDSWRIHRQR